MAGKTVLVVEDNPDDLVLAQAAFARLGADVAVAMAEDGEEALAYLQADDNTHPPPSLVLLDLKLPGIDGFEVLRRIRADERLTILPVVVLSSSVEESDVRKSYRLGANSYVRKPIDFDEFLPLAKHLVFYWLELNQAPATESRP